MYMGGDTLSIMITEDVGRVVTKDEALELVRLAVEDGLIPLLGKLWMKPRDMVLRILDISYPYVFVVLVVV